MVRKQLNNIEIAELLRSVAAAYEIKPRGEANRFRIVAYERAADAIEHATSEVRDLWEEGKMPEIPGIGSSIARHLDELFKTGRVKHFDSVFKGLPEAMFPLMKVPGIGAKTAYKLTRELGIKSKEEALDMLEKAAREEKIRKIAGFGEESEADILKSIQEFKGKVGGGKRMLLPFGSAIAERIVEWLKKHPAVERAEPLGSLRRQVSTVGDVDIAVASKNPKEVIKHFTKFPQKSRVIESGEHTSSILLPGGEQVDLMVQPPKAFGALLQHFTGSKHHNIALREYALKRKLSLSEYGIKRDDKIQTYEDEEAFYNALGLKFIPPELREDTGEIEAAQRSAQGEHPGLPKLVELNDIKGDFHLHSNFPIKPSHDEGSASFLEMVEFGEELGYEYIGFTEHNPATSKNSEREILELIKRKNEAIEKINYSREKAEKKGIKKVFNGLEIDIQPNGKLAVPDKAFDLLDYAIVSIHSSFRQTKIEQTKRVLSGLSHPKAKILGHPTARRLNEREGIDLNWDEIFDFCRRHDKWLEINSWFDRLDLPDVLVREAVKLGVGMIINTDSHHLDHMNLMRYGVSVARRGWAEKKNIVNTLSYHEFVKKLGR